MARAPEWAKHLHECLHQTQREVANLVKLIGEEEVDAEGKITGTGLTGRIIRTEAKVLQYDRLKERIMGGFATATVLLAILWWLTKDRLAHLFGVSA